MKDILGSGRLSHRMEISFVFFLEQIFQLSCSRLPRADFGSWEMPRYVHNAMDGQIMEAIHEIEIFEIC